ncbi:unnamed protein product [Heligmosomoides polygyrus]|uniref:Alba domain-containing protein n=1 Tax=Heligmosomoides polygyrus TaxID=6339 RepID=A0A183FS36_HELPZ|nr:unnamed protein product [Heligmosomoides polygyrus]
MVLKENGGDEKSILVIRGDVRDEEVMKEIVDGTVQTFGRLDVLACVLQSFAYPNIITLVRSEVRQRKKKQKRELQSEFCWDLKSLNRKQGPGKPTLAYQYC